MPAWLVWALIRLAYLWASHFFVLMTLYRHERVMWIRMNSVGLVLTALVFWRAVMLPGPWAVGAELLGMLLVLLPYPIALSARRALGQANWQEPRSAKQPETITRTGPYSRIRHPLYVAMFLGSSGQCLITGSWLALPLVAMFAVLAYANSIHDERKIAASPLAAQYEAYAAQVRGRFIPQVLSRRPERGPASG